MIALALCASRKFHHWEVRRAASAVPSTLYPSSTELPKVIGSASPKAIDSPKSARGSPKSPRTPKSPRRDDNFTNLESITIESDVFAGTSGDVEAATAASEPSEDTVEGLIRESNPPVMLQVPSSPDPSLKI